jgi:peptidoglycan/LPS O-acetylase OafA/YrhL
LKYHERSIGIDCLRALAILSVMGYHYRPLSIFAFGLYGVALFFVISGYCIAFSVNSSSNGWDFYSKRLGRLLPAMIVCGFVTVLIKHLFPYLTTPDHLASWLGAAKSVFSLVTLNAFDLNWDYPDGAYWSLAIEFQFYALCAILMLMGLRRYLLLAVCTWSAFRLAISDPHIIYSNNFFPFFIAGMSIASYQSGQKGAALIGLSVAAIIDFAHLFLRYPEPSMPSGLERSEALWISSALVFLAATYQSPKWLKPVAFVGLISYPMYLLHQDLGNMLLTWLQIPASGAEAIVMRLVAVPGLVILAAAMVFYLVERRSVKPLTAALNGDLYLKRFVNSP